MASTPVTAPSQQPPPTPPEAKSPPPESKSPPPEAKSPPPPEAKSPPPKTSGPPPPSKTSPPPQPEPTPKPSSPPPTSLPTPSAPTAGNTTPQTPPSPATTFPPPSQNAAPSPPTPTNNNPISLPPPSQPIHTPSSGESSPPPPHAPAHRTPSSSSTPAHRTPESDSITEKLPLIVGVAAGAGMLCVIMILVYVVCSKKKKKSGSHDQVQYYADPRNGPKGYYDNGTEQQQNWYNNNNPQMMNQPPQGFMGPPGGGWPQHQQSPTPQLSSGEMSSDPHHASIPSQSPGGNMGFSKSTFTYDELAAATNGFSQANLLGQGGFGYVHKGILPNGKVVAVKSLKSGSGQGEREFQAEVEIISRVHHRHLVSLVGYCIAGAQRMLVYEFVPNGTMEHHLYGKDCPTMEWPKRLTIALGSAKGLAYLHEDCHPRIIHRDIKAANILIDNNFEAMVADFGLAKLSQDNITHVSTRVMGTFGYLAPEYASSGKLSEKSDVFSFGVMLLELITGRKPVDTTNSYMDDSLVDWARPIMTQALSDGNFDELVDPLLKNIYNVNEMERMIACAAASIRHSSRRRPKMSQIVRALEGDSSLEALNEGVLPGQSSAFTSSSESYDTASYNADLKKFRKMALETSEYSGVTSTYGLNPSSSSDSSYSGEVNHPGSTHPK